MTAWHLVQKTKARNELNKLDLLNCTQYDRT